MRYHEKTKGEALTLYLGGSSFLKISRSLNEQYGYKTHASTIKRWADRNLWQEKLMDTRSAVAKVAQRKAMDSVTKHINTLQLIQDQFLTKAKEGSVPISTNDTINAIRLLSKLEHGDKLHQVLAKDLAGEVKTVLVETKVPKAQRNKILQLLAQRLAIG